VTVVDEPMGVGSPTNVGDAVGVGDVMGVTATVEVGDSMGMVVVALGTGVAQPARNTRAVDKISELRDRRRG
jgi:hypothetical protein